MRKWHRLWFAVFVALLSAASSSSADTVYLKNGQTIQGVIVQVTDEFVRIEKGAEGARIAVVIRKSEIASMELNPPALDAERIMAHRSLREGSFPQAVRLWKYVCALEPERVENQLGLARALRLAGDLQAAEKATAVALRLGPENPRVFLEQGEIALAKGNGETAVLRALDAIRWAKSPSVSGHLLLGRAYAESGLLDEAVEAYRSVLTAQPLQGEAFSGLAGVLRAQKKFSEMEVLARGRARSLPREREAWIVLGEALYDQRGYEEAAVTFRKAITLGGPGFDRARVFLIIAEARQRGIDPLGKLRADDHILAWELDPELRRK